MADDALVERLKSMAVTMVDSSSPVIEAIGDLLATLIENGSDPGDIAEELFDIQSYIQEAMQECDPVVYGDTMLISLYLFDIDRFSMVTYKGADLFGKIVELTQTECEMSKPEASAFLESGSYMLEVYKLSPAGVLQGVPYSQIGMPWVRIATLEKEIGELEKAVANLRSLQVLRGVPGVNTDNLPAIDGPLEHIENLKKQLAELVLWWDREKRVTPEDTRERRVIDIDTNKEDEQEDDLPFNSFDVRRGKVAWPPSDWHKTRSRDEDTTS